MPLKKKILSNFSNEIITKRIKKGKKDIFTNAQFWAAIETLIVSIVQFAPVVSLNTMFGKLIGTGTNYFGLCFFSPMFLMISFLFLGLPPLKQLDLITPAFALTLITIKLACFCQGCCRGVECSFGLYNYEVKSIEFPIQLVEAGTALIIFIFLMFWKNRAKEGTMFPTYLIIYSATRFFSEFLRCEPDVIWKLKTYHILCIVGLTIGSIELVIAKKYKDKINVFYNITFIFIKDTLYRFALKTGLKRDKAIIHHKRRKRNKTISNVLHKKSPKYKFFSKINVFEYPI